MNKVRIVVLLGLALIAGCSSGPVPAPPRSAVIKDGVVEVTIRVHGVTDTRGMIRCGLVGDPENWLSAEVDYAKSMPVGEEGEVVELLISNVPSGVYAVSLYQDLEGTNTLSRNGFGIPTDPWGMSNDAVGNFGPPTFEASAVTIEPPSATINITLREGLGLDFEPPNQPFDV
jgi:uncharacterized protein (DUF2141 family)